MNAALIIHEYILKNTFIPCNAGNIFFFIKPQSPILYSLLGKLVLEHAKVIAICFDLGMKKFPLFGLPIWKQKKKSSNVSGFNQWQKSISIYANKMEKNINQSY